MNMQKLLQQIEILERRNAELKKHVAGQQRTAARRAEAITRLELRWADERRQRIALENRLIELGLFSRTGKPLVAVKPVKATRNSCQLVPYYPPKQPPADPKWGAAGELAPDHGLCEFASTKGQ